MSNRVSLPGPQCMVTLVGASDQEISEVLRDINNLRVECFGEPIGIIDAKIHAVLDTVSGDGHAFDYEVNFTGA